MKHTFAILSSFGKTDYRHIEIMPEFDLVICAFVVADDYSLGTFAYDPVEIGLHDRLALCRRLVLDRMNVLALAEPFVEIGKCVGSVDGFAFDLDDIENTQ